MQIFQEKDTFGPEDDSPFSVIDKVQKEKKHRKEPRSSLLNYSKVPKPNDPVKIPLTGEEKEAFDVLLGQLLDDGHVSQACQVANHFGHYDQDLAVVVVCLFVAICVTKISIQSDYLSSLRSINYTMNSLAWSWQWE